MREIFSPGSGEQGDAEILYGFSEGEGNCVLLFGALFADHGIVSVDDICHKVSLIAGAEEEAAAIVAGVEELGYEDDRCRDKGNGEYDDNDLFHLYNSFQLRYGCVSFDGNLG